MKKSHESSSPTNGDGEAHKPNARDPRMVPIGGQAETRQIPVYVVLPPRLLLLDIAGPLEVLRQANRVQTTVHFVVRYVGPRPSLLTSIGVTLNAIEPLPSKLPPEAWIVLAGDVEHVMLPGDIPSAGNSEAVAASG